MNESNQLAPLDNSISAQLQTLDGMERVAKTMANSGMFGMSRPEQAMALMLISAAEGIHPVMALRRYHLIEGKPSMRADAMQGEFETKHKGGILWHVRSDEMVAATFFYERKAIDDKARERAVARFDLQWGLILEQDDIKRSNIMLKLAKLSYEGEATVIRTMAEAIDTGIALTFKNTKEGELKDNWRKNRRAMLTARCITEGIRLINPALIAGIYSTEEELDMLEDRRNEPKTRESILAMIDTIRQQALDAGDGNRRNALLAQVAQLQHELEQMEGASATPKTIQNTAEPATVTDSNPTVILPEKKDKPVRAKKDKDTTPELPVNPAPVNPPAEPAAPATEERHTVHVQDDTPPGAAEPAQGWEPHVVAYVGIAGIKGRKLSELNPEQIKAMKTRWVDAYAEKIAQSKDEKMKHEAKMIMEAFRSMVASGKLTI